MRGKRTWSPEEEMRGYEKVEQGTNLMLEVVEKLEAEVLALETDRWMDLLIIEMSCTL